MTDGRFIEQSYPPSPEARRRVEVMLSAAKKRYDTLEQHDHRIGVAACPICSLHDHSDKRAIGFIAHAWDGDRGEEVPAWWVECPRCGSGRGIGVKSLGLTEWTALGVELSRKP